MKKFTLIMLMVVFSSTFAQTDTLDHEQYIDAFRQYLATKNIVTYTMLQSFCNGNVDIYKMGDENTCVSKSTNYENYFVWIDSNTTYIKKIDNCGYFETQEISDSTITDYVANNLKALELKSVKPYETATDKEKIISRTDVYPCNRNFIFVSGETSFTKTFKNYDLTSNAAYPNIHITENLALELVALNVMYDKAIAAMESSKNFRRNATVETRTTTSSEDPKFVPSAAKSTLKDGE